MSNFIIDKRWSVGFWVLTLFFVCLVKDAAAEPARMASLQDDVTHWISELEQRQPARPISKPVATVSNYPGAESRMSAVTGLPVPKIVQGDDKAVYESQPSNMTVDFYKIDIHNVFRLLGEVSGKNIVVDESVGGTLTLSLREVPWTFVLDVIKNLKGLGSIDRENTIMIYSSDKALQWQGELTGEGDLDVTLEPEIIEQEPEIVPEAVFSPVTGEMVISSKTKSSTPLAQRIKAEEIVKKAVDHESKGNLLLAFDNMKRAINLWPDNVDINKKLASLALQNGDELSAYNYGRKAFYMNPSDNESTGIVAVALARLGKIEEAGGFFEKAMESETISKDILWNYAVFSFSNAKYRKTLRLLEKYETFYDLTPEVIMLKAQSLESLDRIDQAVEEYRTIINAGGSNVPADMLNFAKTRLNALQNI